MAKKSTAADRMAKLKDMSKKEMKGAEKLTTRGGVLDVAQKKVKSRKG